MVWTIRKPDTMQGCRGCSAAVRRSVMNKLADALEGGSQGWQGARYVRIEGATHVRDRHAAVTAFRRDPAIRVALLSVTAAGVCSLLFSCIALRLWHVG